MDNTTLPPPTAPEVSPAATLPPPPSFFSRLGSFFGSKNGLFFLGGLFVLVIGLTAGVVLVQKQQDIRSKAATTLCYMRWPADPATACGQATQLPKQGATDVSLTPNFHWDYGGYQTQDNGQCVQPSGCTSYGVIVYLAEGSYSDSNIIGSCNLNTSASSSPIKDAPFSCFNLGPLKPDTTYSWRVAPFFGGISHAEQSWNYTFKTIGKTTAACQMVSADKDLTKVQIGDAVKFTGYGSVSSDTEKIDKINFVLTKDQTPGPDNIIDAIRALDKDSGGNKFYVATASAQIDSAGSYSMRIKAHWLRADGTGEWKE